jgi:hypothetical protein
MNSNNLLNILKKSKEFFKSIDSKMYKFFIGIIEDETSKNLLRLVQFAIFMVIVVFFINIIFNKDKTFGPWGDFFGGVLNPILTFLTFMGLLITIIIQKKELKESRDVFKGQQEALEKQQEEMTIQSFDNKFFQMLNSFNKITDSLKLDTHTGKEVFKELVEKLKNQLQYVYLEDVRKHDIRKNKVEYLYTVFSDFNNTNDTTFKYYFLNLYQLLKFVDEDIPHKNKDKYSKKYINILRAQLSKNELILLTYNAIGVIEFCGENYKELVEKYAFFEHLTYDDYINNNEYILSIINAILDLYEINVFGKNQQIIDKINDVNKNSYEKKFTNEKIDIKKIEDLF